MTQKSAVSAAAAPDRSVTCTPLFVTVQNAATLCALSDRKIKEMVANRTLRSVFAGGRRLIFLSSIHELLGIETVHDPASVATTRAKAQSRSGAKSSVVSVATPRGLK